MISALPAALAGIAWFLFVTRTTLSVPALTGSIMCMGVATANSILVVSFATEQMQGGKDPTAAALETGFTRFRPVLMTTLAMMIGKVPTALGLGEGGEQDAALDRAVIGGLLFATVSTLLSVPTFFQRAAQIARSHSDFGIGTLGGLIATWMWRRLMQIEKFPSGRLWSKWRHSGTPRPSFQLASCRHRHPRVRPHEDDHWRSALLRAALLSLDFRGPQNACKNLGSPRSYK